MKKDSIGLPVSPYLVKAFRTRYGDYRARFIVLIAFNIYRQYTNDTPDSHGFPLFSPSRSANVIQARFMKYTELLYARTHAKPNNPPTKTRLRVTYLVYLTHDVHCKACRLGSAFTERLFVASHVRHRYTPRAQKLDGTTGTLSRDALTPRLNIDSRPAREPMRRRGAQGGDVAWSLMTSRPPAIDK